MSMNYTKIKKEIEEDHERQRQEILNEEHLNNMEELGIEVIEPYTNVNYFKDTKPIKEGSYLSNERRRKNQIAVQGE